MARFGRSAPTTAHRDGSGTRTIDSWVESQHTLQNSNWKPFETKESINLLISSSSLLLSLLYLRLEITLLEVRLGGRRQRGDFLPHHSLGLLEVRPDCRRNKVLLLRGVQTRMVGVAVISIFQLLQITIDLLEACVIFRLSNVSEHSGCSWLS